MSMTPEEILRSFNQAKFPAKQVQILADLNCSTPKEIKRILIEQGVDGRRLPREKKAPAEAPAQKVEAPTAHVGIMAELEAEEFRLEDQQDKLRTELDRIEKKLIAVQKARSALAEVYELNEN